MNAITTNKTRLRMMHFGNVIGAGIPGAVMIGAPVWARANMFAGTQDPAMFGMTGAIWLAIGISGLLGMRYPDLLKGVFPIQMIYKSIWILFVGLPLLASGEMSVLPMIIFFALIVVGFGYGLFFDRKSATALSAATA